MSNNVGSGDKDDIRQKNMSEDEFKEFFGENDASFIQPKFNIGSNDGKNLRETEFVPTYNHNEGFNDEYSNEEEVDLKVYHNNKGKNLHSNNKMNTIKEHRDEDNDS